MYKEKLKVIIRDDDINFLTSPEVLEETYRILWDRDITICLGIIPTSHLKIKYGNSSKPRYNSFKVIKENIEGNKILCSYLNELLKDEKIEICLHGYDHLKYKLIPEFRIKNKKLIHSKIIGGLGKLKKAFPSSNIRTFIAPYDTISKETFDILTKRKYNLCINTNFVFNVALKSFRYSILFFRQNKFNYSRLQNVYYFNGSSVFLSNNYFNKYNISTELNHLDYCYKKDLPFICINHHKDFFTSDRKNNYLLKNWNLFIKKILSKKNIEFKTFNNFNL